MAPRSSNATQYKNAFFKKASGIPKVAETRAFKPCSNDDREVRVNLFNLSPTIHSCDLRDYFAEFRVKNFSIDFNQLGQPTGTGFVVPPKRNAHHMILKYSGVFVNGMEVRFVMVDKGKVRRAGATKREATIEDIENDMKMLDVRD